MKLHLSHRLRAPSAVAVSLLLLCGVTRLATGQGPPPPPPLGPVPPVPVPAANPLTPAKALLGKILFWDEQLSADDTVACGTCHLPVAGGSDPRSSSDSAVHPGADATLGTDDDVHGSPGIAARSCDGTPLEDELFGWERQVTRRKSPTPVFAAYAPRLFWDGRAEPQFLDPETGQLRIFQGGALESQAVVPILSVSEMGCEGRTWADVIAKLEDVTPLALAVELTPDLAAALALSPDYPALFQAAFGTPGITATRVAYALASYERTLVANQSPFDDFLAGLPGALTPPQNQGRLLFNQNCLPCHAGPLLTDHLFHNIGVRPTGEDLGRQEVTGNPAHAGRFKTPTLRNVALRTPYFHSGGKQTLADVVEFYDQGGEFDEGLSPLISPLGLTAAQKALIVGFLEEALTDPRVELGLPPFDHPTLRPVFRRGDANGDDLVDIADPVRILAVLFDAGEPFPCADAADANDDGAIDLADAVSDLQRLFDGGAPLPAPSDRRRGPDPTADALGCAG